MGTGSQSSFALLHNLSSYDDYKDVLDLIIELFDNNVSFIETNVYGGYSVLEAVDNFDNDYKSDAFNTDIIDKFLGNFVIRQNT